MRGSTASGDPRAAGRDQPGQKQLQVQLFRTVQQELGQAPGLKEALCEEEPCGMGVGARASPNSENRVDPLPGLQSGEQRWSCGAYCMDYSH